MTQLRMMSQSFFLALAIVSIAFFLFAIMKVPFWGVLRISVALVTQFKYAVLVLAAVFWLVFQYQKR